MTTNEYSANAEYINGLLFHARIAMIDAKSNNGYTCFDIKSVQLLCELGEAISEMRKNILIMTCPVS